MLPVSVASDHNSSDGSAIAVGDDQLTGGFSEPAVNIDFRQLFAIGRRNIVTIIGVIVLALVIGLIFTLLSTPRYVATASVQIDQEAQRILNTEDNASPAAYQDIDRFLQTQTDILDSRAMAIRVAQTLHLIASPQFFRAMKADLPEKDDGSKTQQEQKEATLKLIEDNLSTNLKRNSRVVTISFSSPDPDLAARVANTYADQFIAGNLQRKYDSSSYARQFLSGQLAEAKTRLEQSERQLNDYARAAGLIKTADTDQNGQTTGPHSVTTASLIQMNAAANDARTARIAAEEKWRSVEHMPLMNIPDVLSNQAIQLLLQKRAEATADLQQESARHRAAYPTVLQFKAQVDELNQQVTTLASDIRASIRDQYESALKQEQALEGQVNTLKNATLAEQDRSVRYNILAREADTNRTLYDGLLQRYKEVSAESGVTTNNISIVDRADPPMRPSSPKLSLNLLLSLLAGIAIAAAVVFVREQMNDAVRAPEDIERKLNLPVLGVIPTAEDADNLIEALESPRSPIAESYHALRVALLYSTVNGLPRSLLVTSTQPAEGKSTTAFAIAADLARLGKRTVLIDLDLRRPSLHRVLKMSNDVGLSSLLAHQADLAAIVRATPIAHLDFISSGPIPPNPTDLLGSATLSEMLALLSEKYEVVVLDCPPVLGLADAPLLTALTEGTIFVIESDRGHRGATKSAVRRLQAARANLLGAVLTKFDAKKVGYGYAYGYDYYRYGSHDDAEENVA
jgi:capsular exopolysaccharide synthesis family protein